ncbi:kinase-like domain-containing protein [Rhizophagus irregularis DAOM 181602=DAOM 197198]|uniref:Kinase-like domain-containing protein n=1 Tax=Rhizophagus irregularis (strain DAOM 181602 / DAOM 197198 / MUCL 43194) TaxID=747089 RepID=A0A2P4P103_RHIID|nr:kinase-like domain-containing protein [Rhizophagus irregularis DAOM 181602=DAOM 197198]POG59038.1 kinase-like domain-containing protein [Rhizophagus irregularis DAOM 181602=DAOM 197198]|eukprot:XP_025165904.1 kinase-like domain-containing protein [Rhizophagus irregularis DAOM 181602=DAOM 197198]
MEKTAVLETTVAVISHSDTITIDTVELIIPPSQFISLIKDVSNILSKVIELYRSAQHNKNITRILVERISVASASINVLHARDDLLTSTYYKILQRLVQVLHNMKEYIEEITQYNTVQKFLGTEMIEKKFKELCKEYDSCIILLNSNLSVNFNFNTEQEDKIIKEDIVQLSKFQKVLAECINDVKQKVTHTNDQMNLIVERVSEMAITMQSMQSNMKSMTYTEDNKIQKRIDNIFRISSLPFEDYEEADEEGRGYKIYKLRKYVHIKTKDEFAFKVLDPSHINEVKNQVTILMKLKDCQNIINFYGLTSNGLETYLVTEWAEKGNLREYILDHEQNIDLKLKLKLAYDIAKGLNFLNSVKIVHQDIRSVNIVITDHDVAKITNFKYSRKFDEAKHNLVQNEDYVRYNAPEMLRRRTAGDYSIKYDTKCEVYSFGIILWEIAERKVPYDQFVDFIAIAKIVMGGYREKFTSGTDIPKKYQELVNKSVDPNPGYRPIFSKVLTDLQDIFRSLETPTNYPNSLNSNITPPVQKMTQGYEKKSV